MTGRCPSMTEDELFALPVTFDLATAARALGIGRTKAHELARAGEFPVSVLRIGRHYKVRRAELLRALGYTIDAAPAAPR